MNHIPQFCLPIQKTKTSEVDEILINEQRKNDYTYFEIWLDLVEDLSEDWVKKIAQNYDEKLLFVFRRPQLENIRMTVEQRKKLIDTVSETKNHIDLDISQQEELAYIKEKGTQNLLLSYHNYQETPDEEKLHTILQNMETYQPKIYKIATTCLSEKDGLILMTLIEKLRQENKQYIVLGMGDLGKIVRVYAMLYGNRINFAPRNTDEQSASGQLTLEEMKSVYKILESSS